MHQVLLFMLYSPMGTYKWITSCIHHCSQNHTEEFSCPKDPLCSNYPYLAYPQILEIIDHFTFSKILTFLSKWEDHETINHKERSKAVLLWRDRGCCLEYSELVVFTGVSGRYFLLNEQTWCSAHPLPILYYLIPM